MKKTDYSLLLDWEGPSIREMLWDFVHEWPKSLDDYWDMINCISNDYYDRDIDRKLVMDKCVEMGILRHLAEFVAYSEFTDKTLLVDEKYNPFKNNVELCVAKNIKKVCDWLLNDPDYLYRKLYALLY